MLSGTQNPRLWPSPQTHTRAFWQGGGSDGALWLLVGTSSNCTAPQGLGGLQAREQVAGGRFQFLRQGITLFCPGSPGRREDRLSELPHPPHPSPSPCHGLPWPLSSKGALSGTSPPRLPGIAPFLNWCPPPRRGFVLLGGFQPPAPGLLVGTHLLPFLWLEKLSAVWT